VVPPSTSVDEPTTRLLKDRMRRVFRHLPKALAGNEEPLHQLRIAGRRLRVALPLLAQKPEGRRVKRSLVIMRQVTRTAGSSRDLDVMVSLFEDRRREMRPESADLKVLRRRLLAARSRSRRQMAEGLLDLEIARLRRDLRAIQGRGGETLFTFFVRTRQFRDEEGAELLTGLANLADRFDPEGLHRIRIDARRLRYTAELLDAVKGQSSGAPLLFKELQEGLGKIRDAYVLSAWFSRQKVHSRRRGQEGVALEAEALEAYFLEKSREHHRALLAQQPRLMAERALIAMGSSRSAA
jgi:CHAD domain-containing protein